MPSPVPLASPENDAASPGILLAAETAPGLFQRSTAGAAGPDRAEIERELLTRLQEIAVRSLFDHQADTEVDLAPLVVDVILRMEWRSDSSVLD
jgi:hypothetical protein